MDINSKERKTAFEKWFNAYVDNAKKSKYFAELAQTTHYRVYHESNPQKLPDGTPVIQKINVSLYPKETVYEFTDPSQLIPLRCDCPRERFADDGSLKAGIGYYALYMRLKNPYRWQKVPMDAGDETRIKGMLKKGGYDYMKALMRCEKKTSHKQLIVYGAPGTGKSFYFQNEVGENEVVRTTFHPDSDYSTFVGAYKPSMTPSGIGYQFVPQAFVNSYVKAWQCKAEGSESIGEKPVFLIIEEINRGNCAQIFGDLFQLLDRNDYGYSNYPINADTDLAQYLEKALPNMSGMSCPDGIKEKDWEEIKKGSMLALPPNLYIWATMNTSDQSLFPMDSAFKRRWDWEYVAIKDGGKNWEIVADGKTFDWWEFLKAINKKIYDETFSADKQLGYFFVKLKDGETQIDTKKFVNKVIFYLWNDVFRDSELADDAFRKKKADGTDEPLKFTGFFKENSNDIDEEVVADFLSKLLEGVPAAVKKPSSADEEGTAADTPSEEPEGKG